MSAVFVGHATCSMNSKAILATSIFLPIAAHAAVDFAKEVQPILENNCVRCHTEKATSVEKGETDYLLETAKGAIRGKYIVPGDGSKSKVYTTTIQPDDDDSLMPPLDEIKKGSSRRLSKDETETLKKWIDEGAKWPEGVKLIARKSGDQRYPNDNPLLVDEIHKKIVAFTKEKEEKDMKPYTTSIIGTDVVFEMLPIPGGTYKMGSPENEKGRGKDEGPQKDVTVEPFWMGKTEVTWNEFQLFMYPEEDKKIREGRQLTPEQADSVKSSDLVTHPTPPYVEMSFGMGTDGFPAISMTQHAANKFCQWLSARTGHFYRLPTEAEWEYAARAGTTTAYFWGDDASKMGEYAWWGKNADFKYQKVGKKKPNPWGLHDIIGNVAEWTIDQYDPAFYGKMPAASPWNVATQPYPHSVRGGSWDDEDPTKLRAAVRRASNAEWKRQDPQLPKSYWYHTDAQFLGFRVVRPLKVPTAEQMQKYWNNGVEKDDPRMEKVEK
jgi:formylglycine-generating enzyme required for sulfatase activity